MKSIISLVLIAVSVGLSFFYIRPEYSRISDLRAEKSTYEDALAKSKDLKTLRSALIAKYDSISSEDKEKLQRMIPSKFDPIKLILDMSVMMAKYGMNIKGVKVQNRDQANNSQDRSDIIAQTPNNSYKTTTISFDTSGQYSDFLNLLKDIESSVELIDIKKLTVSKPSPTGNLEFKVVVDTYHMD